jgi:sugar lactone lactonase YvrE
MSCTVEVVFSPKNVGFRMGAVLLYDNATPAKLFATKFVSGNGTGPVLATSPPGQTKNIGTGFAYPLGTAADAAGNVYIADFGNDRVVKIPADGSGQTTIGSGFHEPISVAVDGAGNVFVTHNGNSTSVAVIPTGGGAQTTIGTGFQSPGFVSVDGAGNLYVSDSSTVVEVPQDGGAPTQIFGGVSFPGQAAFDGAGNIYFSLAILSQVVEIMAADKSQKYVGSDLKYPEGVAVDPAGNVYIADAGNNRVVVVSPDGVNQSTLASGMNQPYGLALDSEENLYIADSENGRILELLQTSPPSIDFGPATVGSAAATASLSIMNIGNEALAITNTIGPSQFTESDTCSKVGVSDSCTFDLSFTPTTGSPDPGTVQTGTLTLTSNSAGSPQSIALSGNAIVHPVPPTVTLTPSTVAEPLTILVAVSGGASKAIPTGTVVVTSGSYSSPATALSGGDASVNIPVRSLGLGTDILTVKYQPDANGALIYAPASATLTVVVIAPTITPSLSVPQVTVEQPLTMSVTVSGGASNTTPTGTVAVTSGSYASPSIPLSGGKASMTIPAGSLPVGTDPLTVNYQPDASSALYTPASATVSVTVTAVTPAAFAVAGTPVTLTAGATTGNVSTITVTPSGGFSGTVTLTAAITSGPAGAQNPPTVTFGATNTVNLTGAKSVTATLTIATAAATMGSLAYPARPGDRWKASTGIVLACLLIFCIPARGRRWPWTLAVAVLFAGIVGGILACGGSSHKSTPGTTAGDYTVTVTGTSGTTVAAGKITITIK